MKFRTSVLLKKSESTIDYADTILLLGSCFADHIGRKLIEGRFRVDVNPFGTLYNPLSVAKSITRLFDAKPYTPTDLFCYGGVWHSRDHHSDYSDTDPDRCISTINARIDFSSQTIRQARWLIVTLGSAYVYLDQKDGEVVSNCHKQPELNFDRHMISPEKIVSLWTPLLERLQQECPHLHIIFTVSPIRHIRDGLHANQLSKSVLLLAVDALCQTFKQVDYFPAYEIVMDELRDYRFYASDMIHPSEVTVDYIWERFAETYFHQKTDEAYSEWCKIDKTLKHRPMMKITDAYKNFIMQNLLKMKNISKKYPFFELEKEIIQQELLLQEVDSELNR